MRLERYLLRELIVNFVFALAVIYFVVTIGVVIQLFAAREIPLATSLLLSPIVLLMRSDLLTPFAFLVAVLFTYGRVSAENEYIATQACGVHPWKIMAPVLWVGLMLMGIQSYIVAYAVPNLSLERDRMIDDVMMSSIMNFESGRTELDIPQIGLYLTWKRHDGLVFEDVYIDYRGSAKDRKDGSGTPGVASRATSSPASRAATHPADHSILKGIADRLEIINESNAYRFVVSGFKTGGKATVGQIGEVALVVDKSYLRGASTYRPRPEFVTSDSLVDNALRMDRRSAAVPGGEAPDILTKKRREVDRNESRRNWYELDRRVALSLAALLFGMIGAPIAIWLRRGTRLFAIVVALGIVFIIYFPLMKLGDALIQKPHVPIALCAWTASGVMTLLASAFYLRLVRR